MKTSIELPFTDKNLEDQSYRDECDRLAELEAKNFSTWFGRWFFEDGMIKTWVILPQVEIVPVQKLYTYDITIDKCRTREAQDAKLFYVAQKNWIGEAGIKGLKKAFKYLSKHQLEIEKTEEVVD